MGRVWSAIRLKLPIGSLQRRDQEGAPDDPVENFDALGAAQSVSSMTGPSYPPGYVKTDEDERRH
jgi:hypothetical protein